VNNPFDTNNQDYQSQGVSTPKQTIKMKVTTTAIFFFLAATALAAPAPALADDLTNRQIPTARVQLTNEITGRNANAEIRLDGVAYAVSNLYASSPIVDNSVFLTISIALTAGLANPVECTLRSSTGDPLSRLTSRRTYSKLGSNPYALTPVDLTTATITCNSCQSCQAY